MCSTELGVVWVLVDCWDEGVGVSKCMICVVCLYYESKLCFWFSWRCVRVCEYLCAWVCAFISVCVYGVPYVGALGYGQRCEGSGGLRDLAVDEGVSRRKIESIDRGMYGGKLREKGGRGNSMYVCTICLIVCCL